jgi:hypothetical protein
LLYSDYPVLSVFTVPDNVGMLTFTKTQEMNFSKFIIFPLFYLILYLSCSFSLKMVGWKRLEVILLLLIYYDLIMKCISTIISRKSLSSASYAYPPISSVEYDSLYNFFLDTNGPQWTWQSSPVINSTSLFNASIPWNFTICDLLAPCNNDWQGIVCSCSVSNCSIQKYS